MYKKIFLLLAFLFSYRLIKEEENSSIFLSNFLPLDPLPLTEPCLGLKVIGGDPRIAEVWLLGESHNNPKITLDCIARLTNKNQKQVIYLEGVAAGKEISCLAYPGLEERENRICKGWDDLEAHEQLHALRGGQVAKREIIKAYLMSYKEQYEIAQSQGYSDKSFDSYIREARLNLFKHIQALEKKGKAKDPELQHELDAIDFLLEQRRKGLSYRKAFQKFQVHVGFTTSVENLAKLSFLNGKRERALVESIQQEVTSGPKKQVSIFVAGYMHFRPTELKNDPMAYFVPRQAKNIKKILEKNAHQKPYAILVP